MAKAPARAWLCRILRVLENPRIESALKISRSRLCQHWTKTTCGVYILEASHVIFFRCHIICAKIVLIFSSARQQFQYLTVIKTALSKSTYYLICLQMPHDYRSCSHHPLTVSWSRICTATDATLLFRRPMPLSCRSPHYSGLISCHIRKRFKILYRHAGFFLTTTRLACVLIYFSKVYEPLVQILWSATVTLNSVQTELE